MKKLLIINGHEKFPYNEGKLNRTLMGVIAETLKDQFDIKMSILQEGYTVAEERQKFLWADVIIFQMPVYWFSPPALLKKYMEDVYEYGVFYKGSPDYGKGGLLTNKQYMLSTTWNSPASAFNDQNGFFAGKSVDDVLIAFHKTQEFIGMRKLPSFSCHDVVHHPEIDKFTFELKEHLAKVFNL